MPNKISSTIERLKFTVVEIKGSIPKTLLSFDDLNHDMCENWFQDYGTGPLASTQKI